MEVGQAVINGAPSDASQDAVVLLVHDDPSTGELGRCTATVVGPRLVLTARHCVSKTDLGTACTVTGKALAGGRIYGDYDARTMYVFTGVSRPVHGTATAEGRGARILHSGAKTLCDQDLALILLEEPIRSAVIAPLRLDAPPLRGEAITAIGWGVTERDSSPALRQQRGGIAIEDVGPIVTGSGDAVGKNEFGVGESICTGDSGGPGLAADTGAVLGVVSRGGNGGGDGDDRASQCVDASNIYTQIAPFKDLILQAFEELGEEPWLEGGPDPRKAKLGEACAVPDACRSSVCVGGTCSQECASSACPEGYRCSPSANVCIRDARPSSGARSSGLASCWVDPVGGECFGDRPAITLGLVAILVAARRRRGERKAAA